jgi:hypothetical protein
MAIESQGVKFHRLTTVWSVRATKALVQVTATAIDSATAINFSTAGVGALNFTTDMWIRYSTDTTSVIVSAVEDITTKAMYRIKAVEATRISIYGTQAARTTDFEVQGFGSTTIDELTDFSGPSGSARIIDATPVNSTVTRIKTMMRQAGDFSLSMNYNGHLVSQKDMRADVEGYNRRSYAIVFTDETSGSSAYPSWCYFNGYCINYSLSAGVDNKVTANAIIAVDGEMRWSTKVDE